MPVYTISPTLTNQTDTELDQEHPTTTYGASNDLVLGRTETAGTPYRHHIAIAYQLPTLAPTEYMTEVMLRFRPQAGVTVGGSRACSIFQSRRDTWHSGQATWDIYKTANNWGTAGGINSTSDYHADYEHIIDIPGSGEYDTTSAALLNMATRAYASYSSKLHLLMLVACDPGEWARFDSVRKPSGIPTKLRVTTVIPRVLYPGLLLNDSFAA